MQFIGVVLIITIIALYLAWLSWMRHQKGAQAKEDDGVQVFDIVVKGVYSPSVIRAQTGRPLRINFKREEDTECSRFVNFSDLHIRRELPKGKMVSMEIAQLEPGEYGFTCDMGMYQGKLIIE